jgi:hypothetical protein
MALAGCATPPRPSGGFTVREVTPAYLQRLAAADPSIAADGRGHVALTWVTRRDEAADAWLAVSLDSGATFGPPVRLNETPGRVVSFPEGRPAPAFGPGGAVAVAWSEQRGDSSGAVDLRVRASADLGRTLGRIVTVNDDAAGPPAGLRWGAQRRWLKAHHTDAFHGFPTLVFLPDGALFAGWLDGRTSPAPADGGEPRIASLYAARSLDGGQTWSANVALSDSACPCCRPDASVGPGGAVALAWRDGSNDLRDPMLAISLDGGTRFGPDSVVSRDRWRLAACPDQGPHLIWRGGHGGDYVWITGANPPGAYVMAWRAEGGAAGLKRGFADSLVDARQPSIAALGGAALLGIEAGVPGDRTRRAFAVRTLEPDGALRPWTWLGGNTDGGRLVSAGAGLALACWIEHDAGEAHVRLATLAAARP